MTVNCPYADCLLSTELRNGLVFMVTLTSSLSILLCLYVIITIQAYQRYRFQPQRFVRSIFVGNLFFSLAWAQPFHHYASWPLLDNLWQTDAYCIINVFFQGTRFGTLFLEIRLVLYTIYCEYFQREGISSRTEAVSHLGCWLGGLVVGFSFFTACMLTTEPHNVPSRTLHDNTSFCFFAFVGVAALLRLTLYIMTLRYQKLWREHKENFSSPIAVPPPAPLTADGRLDSVSSALALKDTVASTVTVAADPIASAQSSHKQVAAVPAAAGSSAANVVATPTAADHANGKDAPHDGFKGGEKGDEEPAPTVLKASVVADLRIYDSVVKPLRWYPTLFLLFVLPQILITITDDEISGQEQQQLARTILSIFVPFRGFCLALVFIANNKALVRPSALLDRLKARFNAYNMKRDKIRRTDTLREPLVAEDGPVFPTEMWARTLRDTV